MHDNATLPHAGTCEVHIPAGVYAETVTEVRHYTDRLFRFRRLLGSSVALIVGSGFGAGL